MDPALFSVIPDDPPPACWPMADDPSDPFGTGSHLRHGQGPWAAKPLNGVRVVVVDDNADSLEMLSTALAVAGATVTACECSLGRYPTRTCTPESAPF